MKTRWQYSKDQKMECKKGFYVQVVMCVCVCVYVGMYDA